MKMSLLGKTANILKHGCLD